MFRTILVPQLGDGTDQQSLAAAYELLRASGGHLECLYVHDDAAAMMSCIQTDAMGVPVVTPELFNTLNEDAKAERSKAKESFEAFCKKRAIPLAAGQTDSGHVTASWRAASADVTTTISAASRYHDATLLTQAAGQAGLSAMDIGAIAIESGRPLILLPNAWLPKPSDRIAIAWKETPEAARAVTAALPLLQCAKEVSVISVVEDGGALAAVRATHACARYLKRHGIEAESCHVESDGADAQPVLFREAARRAADLMVMGAYGHSRLRELVLGGFTREALSEADMPVLLMH